MRESFAAQLRSINLATEGNSTPLRWSPRSCGVRAVPASRSFSARPVHFRIPCAHIHTAPASCPASVFARPQAPQPPILGDRVGGSLAVVPNPAPQFITRTRHSSNGIRFARPVILFACSIPSHSQFPVERWAALRTAARWEKKLAVSLAAVEVPSLPLMTRFTTSHGSARRAPCHLPPGLPLRFESDFLASKRLTPGTRAKVAQVLRPTDPAKLRTELHGIAELLTDRQLVQERLAGGVGDVVRVVGGPLAGHEGRVVRVKPNRWVLVIEISFLGARMEAEVDERLVEKVV